MHRCIADTSNIDEAVEASGGKKLKWSSRRNILQNVLENRRFKKNPTGHLKIVNISIHNQFQNIPPADWSRSLQIAVDWLIAKAGLAMEADTRRRIIMSGTVPNLDR